MQFSTRHLLAWIFLFGVFLLLAKRLWAPTLGVFAWIFDKAALPFWHGFAWLPWVLGIIDEYPELNGNITGDSFFEFACKIIGWILGFLVGLMGSSCFITTVYCTYRFLVTGKWPKTPPIFYPPWRN